MLFWKKGDGARDKQANGYDYAFGPCRYFLSKLGAWPDPYCQDVDWVTTLRFSVIVMVMFLFATASQTIKIMLSLHDLNVIMEILSNCNIPTSIAMVKIVSIWYHRYELKNLIRQVVEDWQVPKSKDKLAVMWQRACHSRFVTMGSIFLTEGTLVMQCAVGLSSPITYILKLQTNDTSERPLYMKGSFPYDTSVSPNYELSILGQLLCNVFASISFSTSDAFFIALMLHLIGQLSILKMELYELPQRIRSDKDRIEFVERFSRVHAKHQQLYRFSETIEQSFSMMFLIQMVPCIFVLCTQGYQLDMIRAADNVSTFDMIFMIYFLVLFLFTLFCYCYVAELLRQKSIEIGHAAYDCNWTVLPAKEARLLIMVICQAQYPFVITVGKFAKFSLQLFCKIIKTSLGYLSMLLAVKKRIYSDY